MKILYSEQKFDYPHAKKTIGWKAKFQTNKRNQISVEIRFLRQIILS